MKVSILFVLFTCLTLLLIISFLSQVKPNVFTSYGVTTDKSSETISSNKWYSSIYKKFPSQPLFAFPLAYQLTVNGLGISIPAVNKTSDTIFGNYNEDLSVGLTSQLTKPQIKKIGDWSISLQIDNAEKKFLTFTLAQGVPWTVIRTNDQKLLIRLPKSSIIYDQGKTKIEKNSLTTDAFKLTINNNQYIVVLPEKSQIKIGSKEITIESNRLFIGILDNPTHFDLFKKNAGAEITNTMVDWDIQGDTLLTTYQFIGNKEIPLIALFPHQYYALTEKPTVLGSYNTIRGNMKLIKTASFTTSLPVVSPSATFSKLQTTHQDFMDALKEDQQKILHDNQPTNGDYFLGAWYGKAATILLLLDAAGMEKEKQELAAFLKPRFAESLSHFTYNSSVQSVIADKPEFGNEKLNDHHFHYGYYIRTAALLSSIDPSYKETIQNKVNELVGDIATYERTSEKFPYLRNFNSYEAHSFADGFADFADGNNQESSSEAMNAWYSIYLWSQIIKNKKLEDTALYLFNTELQGTKYYWFGKNEIYTSPYNHAIGSIIWGGKVDFATWFSSKTNMKYGIQMLPITPGSLSYLGHFDSFEKYEKDYYDHGGMINDEWGDLFVIFTSFYNPQKALSLKDQATKPETNTPHSLFLYVIYKNGE